MITIKGILDKVTYQNRENHYTVAKLRIPKISDPVTIVGYLAGVVEGEGLEISGKWVSHPRYGDQFKAQSYKVVLPATVSGIRKYLGSGMIKGIGKSLAEKIVDYFAENTLDIIENEPEKLKRIHGIGEVKKNRIEKAWNKHHSVRRVMQFLQENDVGVYHAATILQTYGSEALNILQHDPYVIARDIPQIGFPIADMIAMKAGVQKDDENRLQACLIHILLSFEQEGHVYGLKQEVFLSGSRTSGVEPDKFEQALKALTDSDDIKIQIDDDETKLYLKRLYHAESGIASRMKAILSCVKNVASLPQQVGKDKILEEVLTKIAVKLSKEQLNVVTKVLHEKIVVITGGPGTGKTTLIRALCEIFKLQNQKVVLSAPTGRAARRLSEVTGKQAFTLHKLLGFDHESQTFEKNFANPLELDIFIVDEASMVDTQLMYCLIEALPVFASLIIVGDTFQLPSVGPGNVLSDIIDSNRVKVFFLTKIFRQAKQSPIIMHAHSIRNGEMPDLQKPGEGQLSEFYFIENQRPEKVVETILELCSKRIPQAFPHIDEIQVLTPMHRGEAGTINLNQQLQKVLNDSKGGIAAGGITFKANDKVMHLKNNYDKEVFNGDIGIIHEIIKSENKVMVDYDGRIVEYDILELDELALAYAISVHKSQGSEYAAVIIALTTAHFPLLQRNLLYTAMTRGKKLVVIVGSSKAMELALNNNKTALRLTGLKQKLMSV
ncbi:SF1B family DNA helicase RecD2 [Desulfobacula toluolica]|uniref:RecD2: helicase, RecD/TraA family n=1 Tax=Desulfobacula toluolica (strain DSM 7467 / Tol2) TaxID=651182 RepID=K0NKS4_DESTT|nr:ATP-dependent RecD-like DNA helicase [Desulfobacula toluolica]CCK82166.1 RecD2: helicase, RecD/TraA family [Desulfobacula toluolica Tol2]